MLSEFQAAARNIMKNGGDPPDRFEHRFLFTSRSERLFYGRRCHIHDESYCRFNGDPSDSYFKVRQFVVAGWYLFAIKKGSGKEWDGGVSWHDHEVFLTQNGKIVVNPSSQLHPKRIWVNDLSARLYPSHPDDGAVVCSIDVFGSDRLTNHNRVLFDVRAVRIEQLRDARDAIAP